MTGSWFLLREESLDKARERLSQDVYSTEGAWDMSKVGSASTFLLYSTPQSPAYGCQGRLDAPGMRWSCRPDFFSLTRARSVFAPDRQPLRL